MKLLFSLVFLVILLTFGTNTINAQLTPFEWTSDHWDRLISIKGDFYTFKCPTFSDLDEFEIDMSVPQLTKEYFESYERLSCSDKSINEKMDDLKDRFNEVIGDLQTPS